MDEATNSRHHDRTTSIGKLLSVLNKFLSAGDVAVSFDPTHAALPWAAVRFVIVMATAHNELKGAILTAMAEVTSLLVRCDMYQILYMAPDPALRPLDDFLTKLRICIVHTYAAMQLFFAFVSYQQRSMKVFDVFKLEDAQAHMDKLSGSQRQLMQAADDCERSCNQSNRSDLKELLDLSSDIPIIRQQVDLVLERIDAREERELLEWISPIPYGTHHRVRVETRTPDTCDWLLEHKKFSEWIDHGSSAILWLRGLSTLSTVAISHFHDANCLSWNRENIPYLQSYRPRSSYVRQLSTAVGHTQQIRKGLKSVSDRTRLQGSHLGFEACKTQLAESVNEFSETVIILDALDECNQDSRWQLIHVIKDLVSNSNRPLKVFISSRPHDEDIRTQISGRDIEIQAIDNQSDIEKFINAEMDKPRRWGPIPADLRSKIVQVLCKHSQGMFQWASLQIKQVLGLSTRADIEIKLGKLPKTLEEAYRDIYGDISKSPRRKALVDRACKWVMSAFEPLTSNQLLSAIQIDVDGHSVSSDDQLNESELLDRCSNLLVIDSQAHVWRLSHLSVWEYFEANNHWGLLEVHSHAAKACLQLLIETLKSPVYESGMEILGHMHSIETPKKINIHEHLQSYVRYHWMIHVRTYELHIAEKAKKADPSLADVLKEFLGSPSRSSLQYRAWVSSLCDVSGIIWSSGFSRVACTTDISPGDVPIFVMCRFSFYILLQDCWDNAEITVSQTNDVGDTTLGLAAQGGCKPICEALIQRVTATHSVSPGNFYERALTSAAGGGYQEIVEILIENGADVNLSLPNDHYGSALAAAGLGGNMGIVMMLINNGADVNIPLSCGLYGSALAAAARLRENAEIIMMLIDNGADVNLPLSCGLYGSALAAAAGLRENAEIVNILINNGADVNHPSSCGPYGSALAAATGDGFSGNLEIVMILINNGADVNLPLSYGEYGSALAAAGGGSYGGNKATVVILINNGADVNLPLSCGKYGSALAAAAYKAGIRGNLEIVMILINNGADLNVPLSCGRYGSALAAAVCGGSSETVMFLIENGADVNLTLPGKKYRNALAAARAHGHEEIEKILVDNGATTDLSLTN
ncbi:unnamed protein product [Penicillium olsonii]|uniref:Nephrocystin 3-like N-terminal domain-containing protein n=1 Tax=Penicillium olsonii TaxID=99116 RepID=A0A9W4I8A7_PENOL|nr:unnamed protein product [Penicillium olsonii]CAG8239231.1 unnamed protein product [Penicillium olsonii]